MSQQLEVEDEIIIAIAADLSFSSTNTSSSLNIFDDTQQNMLALFYLLNIIKEFITKIIVIIQIIYYIILLIFPLSIFCSLLFMICLFRFFEK